MADERYILIRPPQLPELAEVQAGAYVVGYDSATDRTVKINVSALGGAEQVTDLIWRSNVEYELNEIKEYGLKLWKSKIAGNQGNIPAENQYWTEVSKAGEGGGITNYATGVYTYSPTIVLRFGKLYRLAATLPFESTDFDAELEIGRWRLLNDSKIIGVAYGVGMTGNYTFVNLDDTLIVLNSGSVNSVKEGASPLTISLSEPSYVVKTGAGNTLSDFTILPIFGGGSGHAILDPAGDTMPTQPALQFGAGFTVTDEAGKTVVGNTAASHIDGAVEEKHQTNQIYEGATPLSTILPQLVNLADIDVSDINVGEKKIIVAEKNAQGDPVFSGGVGLLDVIANPGLSTLLAETNPNWVGDEITLTGNNLDGQLGENSQFFELDADFFLCKSHDNGTTTANGSATWKRNRGTDSLSLSIPAHVNIINQLETETGWNSVAQFKQITAKSKQGSWFRRSAGGYLYMCIDNSNGWTRVGTPPTTDLEITSTSHPVLTASLAAHDFATNRFYVEGTEPTDEPAEQGQEWWDATNKYVYRRNMDGNWARLNG